MAYLKEAFYPQSIEAAKNICITPDSKNPHKFNEETRYLIKFLNSRGLLQTRPEILDFGCGMGRISKHLVDLGCKVVGMDFSIPMLMAANAYVNDPNFTPVINTPNHPFTFNTKFDLIIVSFVLQHVEDPIKEIEFIESVMKEDTTLVIINEPGRLVPSGLDKDRYVVWSDDKISIDQEVGARLKFIDSFDYYNRSDKCLSLWKKK